MAHQTRADAVLPHLFSDTHVAQIIFLHPRRPDDRLSAQAANHDTPRADWTVESQNLQRARNREAQDRAAIKRGARTSNPPIDLGDTMSLPAELTSAPEIREA